MKNKYSAEDVADFFLSKESMSSKRLQKLVFYAYAWVLTLLNDDINNLNITLFDDRIEDWVHGASIPILFYKYKEYGYDDIPSKNTVINFSSDIKDILEQVWDEYRHYTASELESLSHQETPWINARKGYSALDRCRNKMLDKDIYKYFYLLLL